MNIPIVILLGAVCGLIGALVMNYFMRAVGSAIGKRGNMVRALGSFFTRREESAVAIGTAIHCTAGIFFGIIYFLLMHWMQALQFPQAVFLGLGFGFIHGLVTSYALMFYASERHPDEEYRNATIEEGVLHLFGHLIFGLSAGLIGALVAQGIT